MQPTYVNRDCPCDEVFVGNLYDKLIEIAHVMMVGNLYEKSKFSVIVATFQYNARMILINRYIGQRWINDNFCNELTQMHHNSSLT